MGDTTCKTAWKTKDKESRHIEAGKKKIPFNDTNLLKIAFNGTKWLLNYTPEFHISQPFHPLLN